MLVGLGILIIADTLRGSGASPLSVSRWPMKGTEFNQSLTFSEFSLRPLTLARSKNERMLESFNTPFVLESKFGSSLFFGGPKPANQEIISYDLNTT